MEAVEDLSGEARLFRDGEGLVFEVRDGVAHQLELLPALVAAGRRIEAARPGELEQLPVGPPITVCRARGSDEVWVLHAGRRRPVQGDPQRVRRLPWLWTAEPEELPPVPDIPPRLPSNPVQLVPERLASAESVLAEIEAGLKERRGYALVRLDLDDVLVLNQGMWPAPPVAPERAGARDVATAAAALRRAIVSADMLGVVTDRESFVGAPLLEAILFHHDLYPASFCPVGIAGGLLGGAIPLAAALEGRRVALVCAKRLAQWDHQQHHREAQWALGFDVRRAMGLDGLDELRFVFEGLASDRAEYEVVLASGGVAAKALCGRLARELDLVALDLGSALDELLYPLSI